VDGVDLAVAIADAGSGFSWLYLAVLLLVAADAIVPLIPGETAVIAAGALAASGGTALGAGSPNLLVVCAAAALGAWLGDNLAYSLGWRAGPYAVARVLGSRRGPAVYVKAERALARRGAAVMLAARFIPGARTATTIGAGVVGYPRARFRWIIAVADSCWAIYVGLLGYLGGRTFEDNLMAGVATGLGVALLCAAGLELLHLARSRRTRSDRGATDRGTIGRSGATADDEVVEKPLAGAGHRIDSRLERSGVVRRRSAEAGDLADVLERGGPDVVAGDRLGEGRAQGLDAAAHAVQSASAVVRQNQHRAGSAHHLPGD
jgi:membrane protein DedA with SNARE-associated domain